MQRKRHFLSEGLNSGQRREKAGREASLSRLSGKETMKKMHLSHPPPWPGSHIFPPSPSNGPCSSLPLIRSSLFWKKSRLPSQRCISTDLHRDLRMMQRKRHFLSEGLKSGQRREKAGREASLSRLSGKETMKKMRLSHPPPWPGSHIFPPSPSNGPCSSLPLMRSSLCWKRIRLPSRRCISTDLHRDLRMMQRKRHFLSEGLNSSRMGGKAGREES